MAKCYIDICRDEANLICPDCRKPVCFSHQELVSDDQHGRPVGHGSVSGREFSVCFKCFYENYYD